MTAAITILCRHCGRPIIGTPMKMGGAGDAYHAECTLPPRRAGDMSLEDARDEVRTLRRALLQITAIIETQTDPDIDAMHDVAREALNR